MASVDKPFPPGRYPVVIVGSGPGALQTSYCFRRLGIEHAVISSDDKPGGMFQRFPIFQRLISWSKPYAIATRGTREYERYDQNSLLADEPEHQALVTGAMDGTSYFPARAEMERGIAAFVEATGLKVRYGCTWESTRKDGDAFVLTTSDGEYTCDVPIFAVGMAEPWKPSIPGLEHAPHYVETKEPKHYDDRRVFVIGKRNSGYELADGLLPHVRQLFIGSPSPTAMSVTTFGVGSARARYLQPYEDHLLTGGNFVLDVAIERIEKTSEGFRVHAEGTTHPGTYMIDVDDVIVATGFKVPMQDLRDLGVATVMQDRAPALTPLWESASTPGIYFAGTISQGAPGLRKYGIASSSAAVHGFRCNARILATHIASKHFGIQLPTRDVDPAQVVDLLLDEATLCPEVWVQKSYLCRVLEKRDGSIVDVGTWPLQHFVDAQGPDGVAIAIETNTEGVVRPAVYVRRKGDVDEHLLPPEKMHDYRTPEHRRQLESALGELV
ncbi:MAG: NAD(P)-binding domain-containing protein [Actinomycetota bacterium]